MKNLAQSSTPKGASFARETLLKQWLTSSPAPAGTLKFPVTVLAEVRGTRTAASEPLSQTIFIHHSDPAITRKKLAKLGYTRVSEALDRRPKSHNTRLGNFGEVVASEFLRQLKGYDIPVYRLRYNSNDESSPKGDDVLAFEFADRRTGAKDTVIVAEVKVRTKFESKPVEEAHQAFQKGHRPRPKSFAFVVDLLYREGREAEAERLLDLSNKFGKRSLVRRSCLFLITGSQPVDAFGCLAGRRLAPGLEAVQLTLDDLPTFVTELFDAEIDLNAL